MKSQVKALAEQENLMNALVEDMGVTRKAYYGEVVRLEALLTEMGKASEEVQDTEEWQDAYGKASEERKEYNAQLEAIEETLRNLKRSQDELQGIAWAAKAYEEKLGWYSPEAKAARAAKQA